ncbi:hypothetical protein F5141DRAFT_1231701 [Pisolithus sp. B1]|nr:hypothetical protein F5141DRAFT_1231701 [Pisolithus sp. B1]
MPSRSLSPLLPLTLSLVLLSCCLASSFSLFWYTHMHMKLIKLSRRRKIAIPYESTLKTSRAPVCTPTFAEDTPATALSADQLQIKKSISTRLQESKAVEIYPARRPQAARSGSKREMEIATYVSNTQCVPVNETGARLPAELCGPKYNVPVVLVAACHEWSMDGFEWMDRVDDGSTKEMWIRRELDVARSRPEMWVGHRAQAPVEHH